MRLAAAALLVWALGVGGWRPGFATHYRAGLFAAVARHRGLPVAGCLVADDVAELGAWIWVRGVRTGALRRCEVADVSGPADKRRHLQSGLVELDFASAIDICGEWFDRGWRNCPVFIRR